MIAKKHGDGHRLVQHRKAPKLTPIAFSPSFVVSCIRNIHKHFKSAEEHAKVVGELHELKYGEKSRPLTDQEYDDAQKVIRLERELKQIKEHVARFEENSGVRLGPASWDWGTIGHAVKIVLELSDMKTSGRGDVRGAVHMLSEAAEKLEDAAHALAKDAVALRGLMPTVECGPRCRSNAAWGRGRCDCGANPLSEVERKLAADASLSCPSSPSTNTTDCFVPAAPSAIALHSSRRDADDNAGSGSDSGGAGAPEQDAGVQLRDQRAEVPGG